ncbi:PREDICTED: BURP domain-containing protein 16-like isoform X2 [Brassica oleracea var. oleracea]|uniref:BURP domain-containing protein 16-like isoform X2 n=1 Tax=Brassica oleracea var. oleracea TaxID=109376 RepID=UPI0006A74D41|nr:PREDICTED: BURP domain-containing protein 16-like isoform X2 [Brassica oleracea var. oleracea]
MASWRFSITSPTLLLLFSLLVVEAHTSRKLISNKEQEDQNTSHLLKDVYYCHGHKSGARVFEVSLVTDDGRQRVVGPAVCHMNTSMWNADHVAFKVL